MKESPSKERKVPENLKRIIITNTGRYWTITREWDKGGETAIALSLEKAFDFVRAVYEEDTEEEK